VKSFLGDWIKLKTEYQGLMKKQMYYKRQMKKKIIKKYEWNMQAL
jgi:hypothetical protein